MQFSRALRALPVAACLAFAPGLARFAAAQARARVTADAWLYLEAGKRRVARVLQGAVVTAGADTGAWQSVTLSGWIFQASVGPAPHPGFDVAVTRDPEENLRATPAGTLIAKLPVGFLLTKLGEDRHWVHVQRAGWMAITALSPLAAVASGGVAAPDSQPPTVTPAPPADSIVRDSGLARLARRSPLYRAPEGLQSGVIAQATPLRVLGRAGEWSRIAVVGWVKTADLEAAPPGVVDGLSAAELRAAPDRYVGQQLRWTLQFLAIEQADELRPEMPPGAWYLLARGPLPERGFVYVVVPDATRAAVAALPPLSLIRVIARVRTGRTRYLGNPVVDLLSFEVQSQP
jgi:hypothetical protein